LKIHHFRNATFVIESEPHFILIDPMLSQKGELPPFARFRHRAQRNPIVPLPENTSIILEKITHCLITHSQKFGIKALQHTDHLDNAGVSFLREKNIPVITLQQDALYLKKLGLNVISTLKYWQSEQIFVGEITAIPALHGHSWINKIMANGAGFYLQLIGEPSIYISGDTVYTKDVEQTLTEFKPDIAVVAAGSARLDIGDPILMTLDEIVTFVQTAPKWVIANHLEALDHCSTTRLQLRNKLEDLRLSQRVFIPNDGETIVINKEI